jgi:RecA-family ATPase
MNVQGSFHDMPPDDRFGPSHNPFLEATVPRASRFFPASDLSGRPVPPRQWLVRDLVPLRTVTLLGGDGGTGKSLLALQLAHAVAVGGTWLGRSVTSGGALFISAEDDEAELHRRMADVVRASNGILDDLDRLTLRSLAGEDALLAVLDRSGRVLSPSPLFHEIDRRIAAETPSLVVLDTLADLFPGNENDRAQARQFVGLLRGLAIRHDCAMLLLAHPSLSGLNSGTGTSGSTGWNNSVRSRLYLERVIQDGYEADPDARLLSTKKANYGRTGGEISVTWRDGVFVADAPETGLDRMATTAKAERVFLKLLDLLAAQGRRVNAGGGQTYAPTVFLSHPEAEGVNKRGFRSAMESLLAAGKIRLAEDGPPSKRRQFLEAVK